ncbi:MAG: type II toxin-antitoxin system RelE/ParE family toxin [Magnetococcales bacterium]|nr:type II toxin-antitoxin system RelE/ParE family toxin [Magnetococcales bacterium]
MVVLHSFVKKTQEIPKPEIDLARKRLKELHHGR